MIISHKYKFIFLKTKKTAGTSIEISLSRFCGDDDIIIPINLQDEAIRKLLGKKPQNYLDFDAQGNVYQKYFPHITSQEVISFVLKEILLIELYLFTILVNETNLLNLITG